MIMAKKNQDIGKGGCGKQQRSVKNPSNAKSPVKIGGGGDRVPSPTTSNPRTSPGLLAGHYAGCKWSEPPLPSALPLPPQHWMLKQQQQQRVPSKGSSNCVVQPTDIAQQLKVLLKVQA